jgi:hypothetical protein
MYMYSTEYCNHTKHYTTLHLPIRTSGTRWRITALVLTPSFSCGAAMVPEVAILVLSVVMCSVIDIVGSVYA